MKRFQRIFPHNYVLVGQTPVHEPDLFKYLEWRGAIDDDGMIVRKDQIGATEVSTVFLGLDHSFGRGNRRQLFETAFFINGNVTIYARCATWAEAEQQHAAALKFIKDQSNV